MNDDDKIIVGNENDLMSMYLEQAWKINTNEGQLIFLIFNALLLGLGKGGVPGLATVATALTVATAPPGGLMTYAVGLQVPILTMIDISAAYLHKNELVWPPIYVLLPFTVMGMIFGQILDKYYLTDANARLLVGILLLVILGFQVTQSYILDKKKNNKKSDILPTTTANAASNTDNKQYYSGRFLRWGTFVGMVGGAATMLTNAMGPILNVYLLSILQLNPSSYIGTRAMFFCLANLWKLPMRFIGGSLALKMMPLAIFLGLFSILGVYCAKPILLAIPPKHFVILELAVVALSGVRLCYMGLNSG